MSDPRHTHVFSADSPHAATYTPLRDDRYRPISEWMNNGIVHHLRNPSAMLLAWWMCETGEPTHGGWVTATYIPARFREATGLGENAAGKALNVLLGLGVVKRIAELPGDRYRVLPAPDWPIPATDEQLALDFGSPSPGTDEAAQNRDEPRQGEARRDFSDPRVRAGDDADWDSNPRVRAGEDFSDPRECAGGGMSNPRVRAGQGPKVGSNPRERAGQGLTRAFARVIAAKQQQEEEEAAAADDDSAREDLVAAVDEAAIADPLRADVLAEPGMTAAIVRWEADWARDRGKGPAIIARNAIAKAKSRIARRERRRLMAERVQLQQRAAATNTRAIDAERQAIDLAIGSLTDDLLDAWARRVYAQHPHLQRSTIPVRRNQVMRALIYREMRLTERDQADGGAVGPITDAGLAGPDGPPRR